MDSQETSSPVKQVTFTLPEELHRRFRLIIVKNGKTMQGMLEEVVGRYVEREEARRDE